MLKVEKQFWLVGKPSGQSSQYFGPPCSLVEFLNQAFLRLKNFGKNGPKEGCCQRWQERRNNPRVGVWIGSHQAQKLTKTRKVNS